MPRALIVSTVAVTIESFLVPMARGLRASGWEVHAASQGASASEVLRQELDGAHDLFWDRSPADVCGILASMSALRRLQGEHGFEVVHVHTPVAAFYGRLALRGAHKSGSPKILYTAHGFHFYEGQSPGPHMVYSSAELLAGRWTDYLVTMNQEDYAAARRFGTISPGRVRMIHGIGIDADHYSREAVGPDAGASVRQKYGIPASAPVLLMIAELNQNKRPLDVIRAFVPVARETGAHLLIAGDGPLEPECMSLAVDASVDRHLHLAGRVADVRPYILTSVVAILYSTREGLPRSILECMSMGVPVIGSDIRGIADLLGDGAGWLVPPREIDSLTRAMLTAIENPEECTRKGRIGQRVIHGKYEVGTVVDQYVRLYGEALTG